MTTVKSPRRWYITWGGAVVLLLLPAVAMQFTDAVNWGLRDFVIFGLMLAAALGIFEVALHLTTKTATRVAAGLIIAAAFFLVWQELAVGIAGPG